MPTGVATGAVGIIEKKDCVGVEVVADKVDVGGGGIDENVCGAAEVISEVMAAVVEVVFGAVGVVVNAGEVDDLVLLSSSVLTLSLLFPPLELPPLLLFPLLSSLD
jgi:hypothetical protein